MSSGQSTKRRCVVVVKHLSHYRQGVYSELDRNPDWEFSFVGSLASQDGSIEALDMDALSDVQQIPNIWLPMGLLWQKGLLRTLLARSPHVVVLEGNAKYLSTWFVAMILRLCGVKVLYWTTGWHAPDGSYIKRLVRLVFYRLAHGLLLYGQDGWALAASYGYPASRMRVIGNSYGTASRRAGANDSDSDSLPKEDFISRLPALGPAYVGAVVRPNPNKRLDLLIRAVSVLRGRGCGLQILIVGEGSDLKRLTQLARELEVPLTALGAAYGGTELDMVYERLKVTVVPEMAGLTTVQSLAHGVPVVTVDDPDRQAPEYRAVIPGVTGQLYESNNVEALAAAIEECLRAVLSDPGGTAERCRREVKENWSSESHAQRIVEAITTIRRI